MKKILLILFLGSFLSSKAQLDYSLTSSTSNYVDLTGATDISIAAWDMGHKMAMPFPFKFFSVNYDSIQITFDGFYFADAGDDYVFYGTDNFMPEDYDVSLSPISYQVSGSAPNRILKIEWKNVREANVDTASHFYYLNNQVWLYENGNKIEYHFGDNVITDPNFDKFYIGIIDYDNSPYYAIDSSAANPVLVRVTNAGTFNGIPTYPVSDQVYTLTPNTSKIDIVQNKPYNFFSTNNSFTIQSEQTYTFEILDINGRLISNSNLTSGNNGQYNLTNFAPGIYMVNIRIGNQFFTEKTLVR